MRPLVHLSAADPAEPEAAIRACTNWVLRAAPARRGVVVIFRAEDRLPGATITPWCLRGLDQAIPLELASRSYWPRGDLDTAQQLLDSAGLPVHARVQAQELRNSPRVRLSVPGFRRPAAIPRDFVGRNLILVAPLSHRQDTTAHFLGPSQSTLALLAELCRLEGSPAALAKAGARIARECFATSSLVLDGTWWAPLDTGGQPVGDAVAIEHFLCTPSLGTRGSALAVDSWIGRLLGHPPTRADLRRITKQGGTTTPRIAGSRRPWPSAPLPGQLGTKGRELGRPRPPSSGFGDTLLDASSEIRSRASGLAHRAFDALWMRPPDSNSGRLALAAPVPGAFASHWAREMNSNSHRTGPRPFPSQR
jgi:hypothetical protein